MNWNPLLSRPAARLAGHIRRHRHLLPTTKWLGRFGVRVRIGPTPPMVLMAFGASGVLCLLTTAMLGIAYWLFRTFFFAALPFWGDGSTLALIPVLIGITCAICGLLFLPTALPIFIATLCKLITAGSLRGLFSLIGYYVSADTRHDPAEIEAWAEENVPHFWLKYEYDFFFVSMTDAIYFKLRWVG